MRALFLIKPGEIELKRGNKREFTQRLKDQIHRRLRGLNFELEEYPGRFFSASTKKIRRSPSLFYNTVLVSTVWLVP